MNHSIRIRAAFFGIVILGIGVETASAQPAPKPAATATAAAPSNNWISPGMPFRKLAPGVLHPVDPTRKSTETVEHHDILELLAVNKNFDFAKDVTFRHDIWMLDIKFKPMRMIAADIPGPDNVMHRKLIWYMVYQVTNPGQVWHPIEDADKTWKLESVDKPLRFIPNFSLEEHNQIENEAPGSAKVYSERYEPLVLAAIRAKEDENREFLPTAKMLEKEIPVGQTVWGVATWQDIDPRNVWFSVYVEGLTNAYFWNDDPTKFDAVMQGQKGPFRQLFTKSLRINFWRPGDEFYTKVSQIEGQVRLGTPSQANGTPGLPAYDWVWRRVL